MFEGPEGLAAAEELKALAELRAAVVRSANDWLRGEERGEPLLLDDEGEALHLQPGLGDAFIEAQRSMLILGEPGSGKSVTLRQLALALAARAERDPLEPVPVLLDLSGWTPDAPSFLAWLISDQGLRRPYGFRTQSELRDWLESGRLVLLLDGLDEVHDDDQAACVEAINAFIWEEREGTEEVVRRGGLAVCCRWDEYKALKQRGVTIGVRRHWKLQPLDPERVSDYLSADRFEAIRTAWESDDAVRQLLRSPLMLRLVTEAFAHADPAEVVHDGSLEALEDRLVDAYVEHVLKRAEASRRPQAQPAHHDEEPELIFGGEAGDGAPAQEPETDRSPYSRAQVEHWLTCLAWRLETHAHSTFYPTDLQPSWFTSSARRVEYALLSRGLAGVMLGVCFSGFLLLCFYFLGARVGSILETALVLLSLSLLGALVAGALDAGRLRASPGQGARSAPSPALPGVARLAERVGLIALVGLLGALLLARNWEYGLILGFLWGALVVYVFEPAAAWRTPTSDVRLAEPLGWRWRAAFRAAQHGLAMGGALGALLGLLMGVTGRQDLTGLVGLAVVAAAIFAVVTAAILGVAGGWAPKRRKTRSRLYLGLRLAGLNAAVTGLSTTLATWAVLLPLFLAVDAARGGTGFASSLILSVAGAAFFGLSAALHFGGLDLVNHFTLRVLLARAGHLPGRLARFYDYATDLSLMRRSGGGYAFAHAVFRKSFARRLARSSEPPKRARATDEGATLSPASSP